MIFFEMIFQMLALIFVELSFLNEVMILRTGRYLLFPAWNIQFILAFIVGPNLEIPIQTTLLTHGMVMIRHLN